ncbi:hypothetical protein NE237_008889 [Protea cynaroides]|uniref:Uncharacterized protein n=1 Tax=Protea cynaroides TaxID=273540 RepID=A0A9Q0KWW9_9MAGN|nr:hypothetical protein NE237_008889 [Protea cynaroides]
MLPTSLQHTLTFHQYYRTGFVSMIYWFSGAFNPLQSLQHLCEDFKLQDPSLYMMEQFCDTVPLGPQVKATLCLGSETYYVNATKGILSEQLVSMKAESMSILKDFITKHNVPNDVPDEVVEGSSEEDDEEIEIPPKKSKKQK